MTSPGECEHKEFFYDDCHCLQCGKHHHEIIADFERQLADAKAEIKTLRNYAVNVTESRTVTDAQLSRWAELCEKGHGSDISREIRAAREVGDE